jgi:hypothetical protein
MVNNSRNNLLSSLSPADSRLLEPHLEPGAEMTDHPHCTERYEQSDGPRQRAALI